MKYRIRNTETGELIGSDPFDYYLWCDGLIYRDDEDEPLKHLKAEMEVADGVYEGDHLLHYDSYGKPSIYEVSIINSIDFVGGCFSSESLPELNCDNFEVIQCR